MNSFRLGNLQSREKLDFKFKCFVITYKIENKADNNCSILQFKILNFYASLDRKIASNYKGGIIIYQKSYNIMIKRVKHKG